MNITRGAVKTAKKIGIYGPEGVGKTTFASMMPGVVFIDTEGSTVHMDVARFDPPAVLKDVKDAIQYVIDHPDKFGTLAIDTIDSLEKLIFRDVCAEKGIRNIEDIGYGKGYVYAKQTMQSLLEMLDKVAAAGVHVVLVCHSMIRKFEQPDEMGSYDRYMLKLNEKNIAPLVKEWVDALFFVNYKTDVVVTQDGKKKARGGQKRVMYANHSACWDAKNRFGLPDEMPMEFDQIAKLFGEAEPVAAMDIQEVSKETPKTEVTPMDKIQEAMILTKKTRKKADAPKISDRPEDMRSDDPDKDKLLAKVWELMLAAGIWDTLVLQAVVAEKDYYEITTPIRDYERDFIEGCLIEAWDTVRSLCATKMNDLPF